MGSRLPFWMRPPFFGAFVVDEQHAGEVAAVGASDLGAAIEGAGKARAVGEDHARRAVGLDDVDAVDGELVGVAQQREGGEGERGEAGEDSDDRDAAERA